MVWLESNWLPLTIVVLVILAFIGWVIYLCKKKGLRETALEAILVAEKEFSSGEGKEKMEFAVNYVFDLLPVYLKALFPKDLVCSILEKFIQKLFDEVKKLLEYQKVEGGKK